MSFYTYMLRCSDGSYYTGHTENLDARLYAHQHGILKCYTTSRRPVELVWCEGFESREEAFLNERRIKGWSRAKKAALVAGDWAELVRLAAVRRRDKASHDGLSDEDAGLAHPSRASG